MTEVKKIKPAVPSVWRHPFATVRHEMSDLINRLGGGEWDEDWFLGGPLRASAPVVDIYDTDGGFEMKAELPGLGENDFDLTIKNGVLELSGEKRHEKTEDKEQDSHKYHVTERSFGSFRRSFRLPDGVQQDKINAVFENGVLTVTIPVSEDKKPKVHKVPVKKSA
ncbi:MAG: Hsp20/alpha crystallin family protein [Rhodospirillaceae bacterium]